MKNKFLFSLCTTAILTALAFGLEAYGKIPLPFLELSLAFVPILFCGMLQGPIWAMLCAFLTDFIATTVAGSGTYFIGFAPAVLLTGCLFGLIGLVNNKCKSTTLFCVFTAVITLINALLSEGVLKSAGILAYQVFISNSAEQFSVKLLMGIFAARFIFVLVQGAVVFALALLGRKQILPKIQKATRSFYV